MASNDERLISANVITVSNRLPVTIATDRGRVSLRQSDGGLATGLRAVIRGDGHLWIGWPGDASSLDAEQKKDIDAQLSAMNAVPIALTAAEVKAFYDDISNGVLWPICHDRIDRLPLVIDGWETYEKVNQRYADAVVERWRPGDVVWVHDYQLLRVPLLVRRKLPEARIGFFLHVPFPNPEIFFTLSVRRWLMEGMLGAIRSKYRTACAALGVRPRPKVATATESSHTHEKDVKLLANEI